MDKKKIIEKVTEKLADNLEEKSAALKMQIRNDLNNYKSILQKLIQRNNYENFNKNILNLATQWKILNDQNQFGDMLQEIADWELNYDEDYKENLMQLGKKYNVLGIKFKHLLSPKIP